MAAHSVPAGRPQYISLAEELLLLTEQAVVADALRESRRRLLALWPPVFQVPGTEFTRYAPALPPRLSSLRAPNG